MKLFISFSGRKGGNCDRIASYLAEKEDRIVCYRTLHTHACSACAYECFDGACKYQSDDVYGLYVDMLCAGKVVWIVPMYCGSPSSLYFAFNERGQDFFMHNDVYEQLLSKLYIIGVYGKRESAPDFIPCLENRFSGTLYRGRVLGIERHLYGQMLSDCVLDVPDIKKQLDDFLRES